MVEGDSQALPIPRLGASPVAQKGKQGKKKSRAHFRQHQTKSRPRAGIHYRDCELPVIVMDADLQDPTTRDLAAFQHSIIFNSGNGKEGLF